MVNGERQYSKRRTFQEIEASRQAESVEAEMAHAGLASLHQRRCADCSELWTAECLDCPLACRCDFPREVRGAA